MFLVHSGTLLSLHSNFPVISILFSVFEASTLRIFLNSATIQNEIFEIQLQFLPEQIFHEIF